MNTKKLLIPVLMVGFIFIRCSDPVSGDNTELVKTIVQGYHPAGLYVYFWDGTDRKGNFVSEGTYIARLYAKDFTFEVEMTALAGTSGTSNDSTAFPDFTYQPLNELRQNRPNPFKIKDGTNLLFTLSEDYAVELTVRKPKS